MSTAEHSLILDHETIRRKITRMAYEIVENNFGEKTIVLAGIEGQGHVLARLLEKEISAISKISVLLVMIRIDKSAPEKSEVGLDVPLKELRRRPIIMVDDVLNTGKILTYSMKPFLSTEVKKIEVAVLVNRSHLMFPVHPRYTGYALSTTLSEHIEVILGKKSAVYLH